MPNKLNLLILEKRELQENLMKEKNVKNIRFFNQRIKQIGERIAAFGQRYNVIQVSITYFMNDNEITQIIYYTDISESDAILYTKSLIEINFKIKEITAIEIPVGKLLNKV